MTCKDALYRELVYGTVFDGLLSLDHRETHIKADVRIEPDEEQDEDDYPWLIFRRIDRRINPNSGVARDMYEFEWITKLSSPTKGDDLIEVLNLRLVTHFNGKRKTWGKFDDDGNPDASGGLLMTATSPEGTDAFDDEIDEKNQMATIAFAYLPQ